MHAKLCQHALSVVWYGKCQNSSYSEREGSGKLRTVFPSGHAIVIQLIQLFLCCRLCCSSVAGFVCHRNICSGPEHASQDCGFHQLQKVRWQRFPLDHIRRVHPDEWACWEEGPGRARDRDADGG